MTTSATSPIAALVFDIGGVLALSPEGREPMAEFDALLDAWDARTSVTDRPIRGYFENNDVAGKLGLVTHDAWISGLRDATPLDDAQVDELVEAFWTHYLGEWNTELGRTIEALRGRYRVGLLSNSFLGAREREQARYGLSRLAHDIVYSHEVHLAKPDPRIYLLACERLGVAPEHVVFVDDVPANVDAATALGMRGILFRDTATTIAELDRVLGEPSPESGLWGHE
jgi:epoxide hydrolase-like predicted phosphatase